MKLTDNKHIKYKRKLRQNGNERTGCYWKYQIINCETVTQEYWKTITRFGETEIKWELLLLQSH